MSHIIKILNLASAEILTLEKTVDRLEFEALPVFAMNKGNCTCKEANYCGVHNFCVTDDPPFCMVK